MPKIAQSSGKAHMHLLIALQWRFCFGFESGKMGQGGQNACMGARGEVL